MKFVVDKLLLEKGFLRVLLLLRVSSITPVLPVFLLISTGAGLESTLTLLFLNACVWVGVWVDRWLCEVHAS